MSARSANLLLGCFLTVSLGMPFLFVAVAQRAMPTSVMAFSRFVLASATLLVLGALRAGLASTTAAAAAALRRQPLGLVGVAVALAVAPNLLIGAGEHHIGTGITSVLVATTPLWIALGARFVLAGEHVGTRQAVALLAAFAGSVLLTEAVVPPGDLVWAGLPALSAISYALGNLAVRRFFQGTDALTLTLVEMTLAALLTAPLALAQTGGIRFAGTPWLAVLALGAVCSGLGWFAATSLVQRVGPTHTSLASFSSTLVAVALGALVLHERLSLREGLGAAIVVVAIAAFLVRPSLPRPARGL